MFSVAIYLVNKYTIESHRPDSLVLPSQTDSMPIPILIDIVKGLADVTLPI